MRDNGATWDADEKKWKRTLWKSVPEKYRVTYDDGSEEYSDEEVKEDDIATDGRVVSKVETIPCCWELCNEYVSSDEKPEWDEYKTRETYYVEEQPITVQVPLSRQGGPDTLVRRQIKHPRGSQIGTLR